MSWGSALYYIHTIYITVLVGPLTVEKFNPQLIFRNSNTAANMGYYSIFPCSRLQSGDEKSRSGTNLYFF